MNKSATITKFAAAFLKAQQAITFAEKKADNPFFKSKYADLPTVIAAIKPALNDNGITFLQLPSEGPAGSLTLTTTLLHESGEWIESTGSCPLGKQDPQAFGSAMTYFRRYALASVTGLFQDDDDAQLATHGPVHQPAKTELKQPAKTVPVATAQGVEERPDVDDASWREVTVPPFIKKYAGATLGQMADKDLIWWADNYEPKPFKGVIQQKDLDFKEALEAAKAELSSDVPY